MELIHDSLKIAYAFFILHRIEIFGGITFIVFIVRLTKKEAGKTLINKILSDAGMALVYTLGFWYYLRSIIGVIPRAILWLLFFALCYNVSPWRPSLISYLSTIDPNFGSASAPQLTMAILILMVFVTLVGYFFDAPVHKRELDRFHLEKEQRIKANDLSAPDKWNKAAAGE
jgi:hypothetical protein